MKGDPRLARLLTEGFRCASCGDLHEGIFDVAFDSPMGWDGPKEQQSDDEIEAALTEGRDILTKNFCLDGEHRFVRAIIPFRIQDSEETFAFGVWGSLSHRNFRRYLDNFFGHDADGLPPSFSWLSNILPGGEAAFVRCLLHPQPRPDRPILEIGDEDHPFFSAQSDGISIDRLIAIYAATGHALQEPTP